MLATHHSSTHPVVGPDALGQPHDHAIRIAGFAGLRLRVDPA